MKRAILILISFFLCLTCSRMLEWTPDGTLITHHYSVWGDWSAHFSFISNLMERGIGWIMGENPLFAGIPFQYPFLSHVLTAGFAKITNLSVVQATLITSLGLLFALPFGLDRFFRAIGLSHRQSIIGIFLFIFLGGFQAFDSSLNINDPLTNQINSGSVFTQVILFELIPQRAFLFGMVLFLFTSSALLNGIQQRKSKITRRTVFRFFMIALTFSLLAWIHLHSWIAMGAFLFSSALMSFFYKTQPNKKLKPVPAGIDTFQHRLLFGILVAALSTPLIYFLIWRDSSSMNSSALQTHWNLWSPGWAQSRSSGNAVANKMNFFVFWIYNTGIMIGLSIFGKYLTWSRRNTEPAQNQNLIFSVGLTGSILAVVALLFNLQPYYYDNLKIFTYAFLFFTPFAAKGIDYFFQKPGFLLRSLGALLLIAQCYSGFHDYVFYLYQKHGTVFFSSSEFKIAEKFKAIRRSPDSLVVIAPKHNHWVPALSGNPVFMGYPGWLWTWGIQYSSREQEVNTILSGGELNPLSNPESVEQLIQKYNIEYIVIHDQDKVSQNPVAMKFFQEKFQPILEQDGWHVYQVK